MPVIEVEGLSKHFPGFRGGTTALQDLSFEVPEGGVFGFLGPNGSGKTTTIRCLMDLVRPSSGDCRILGTNCRGDLHQVIARVGAIVETPKFFGRFSARRNLFYLAKVAGADKTRVNEVLEFVGLGGREKDLVRDFSLGMNQRLGLAAALIKNPDILILDEPAHGLDPAGIKEIRGLLRRLGDEGRTVFLSSHLLAEVEAICDTVVILSNGRKVAEGPVDVVLARGQGGVEIEIDDIANARVVLSDAGFAVEPGKGSLLIQVDPSQAHRVTQVLATKGLYLRAMKPVARSLEDVFLELTAEESAISEVVESAGGAPEDAETGFGDEAGDEGGDR